VSTELVRLYADYLHEEYGDLDSDYIFVNLWGRPHGHPLAYPAVYDLVRRLRRRTGIDFDPHWYRHTTATRMLRDGVPIEVVSTVLGHASITTTLQIYGHLTSETPAECWRRQAGSPNGRCRGDQHASLARVTAGAVGQTHGGGPARVPCR
jgi:site-specific recombinase XerD